jgi:hypothetical protein
MNLPGVQLLFGALTIPILLVKKVTKHPDIFLVDLGKALHVRNEKKELISPREQPLPTDGHAEYPLVYHFHNGGSKSVEGEF